MSFEGNRKRARDHQEPDDDDDDDSIHAPVLLLPAQPCPAPTSGPSFSFPPSVPSANSGVVATGPRSRLPSQGRHCIPNSCVSSKSTVRPRKPFGGSTGRSGQRRKGGRCIAPPSNPCKQNSGSSSGVRLRAARVAPEWVHYLTQNGDVESNPGPPGAPMRLSTALLNGSDRPRMGKGCSNITGSTRGCHPRSTYTTKWLLPPGSKEESVLDSDKVIGVPCNSGV